MNDYNNNWFYKLCKNQCAKDFKLIVIGLLLMLFSFWLFAVSVYSGALALLVAGIALMIKGARSYIRWLPDVKNYLSSMQSDEFARFSAIVPQAEYGTFYFTDTFLCIPSQYMMMRYHEIGNMTLKQVYSHKYGQKGVDLIIDHTDGRAPVRVHVKEWKMFESSYNNFLMLVQQHRQIGMQY